MSVVDTFTATSGAASTGTATLTLTVPRAVSAGKAIVLITERGDAGNTPGVAGITDSRGNGWNLYNAISQRGNVTEVAIHRGTVTVPLQVGDSITVTWNAANASRKNIIAHVVDNLLSPAFDVGSGATVPAAAANIGPNGSSASPSGSTTAATTVATDIVFSAVAFNTSGGTFTHDAAYTAGTQVATSSGSSDRALASQYRQLAATGVQTAGGSLTSSTAWAMAVAAFKTSSSTAPTVTVRAGLTAVEPGTPVVLTAVGTPATGHSIQSYVWTQTAGPSVVLTGDGGLNASVTYTSPAVNGGTSVSFSVTAIDDTGAASSPATVTDTIAKPPERLLIGGTWVPARWGLLPAPGGGGGGGGGGTALALTATPDPTFSPPRIRLDVTDTRTTPVTSLTIYRRDPDGHTYPVRTSDGGPLPVSAGLATFWDYEAPFDSPITYSTDQTGGPTAATELLVDDAWLIHPGVPIRSQRVDFRVDTNDQELWDIDQGTFAILGSDKPIVISSGARLQPASRLVLSAETLTELAALRMLLSDGSTLLLNVPPALGLGIDTCYVSIGKVSARRRSTIGDDQTRDVELPYQVVGRPGGGTQAAITWNDVVAAYPSWQAIVDAGITSYAQLAAPTT